MKLLIILVAILFASGCSEDATVFPAKPLEQSHILEESVKEKIERRHSQDVDSLRKTIIEGYDDVLPTMFGENIDGVKTMIDTDEKVVALTFDACVGTPDSFDEELINILIEEEVQATLFMGGQWIQEYEDEFLELADNPLFEIANHGYVHQPLSVTGEKAYNIQGTENVAEVFDEIYINQMLIEELTGQSPKYFRSGTAYYDDVSVDIIHELGLKAVNYNVLGDAGGTFNENQIIHTFETAKDGSIFLFHMNPPYSDIASGVEEGIKFLKENGFEFVQLSEYDELLK